MPDVSRMPRRLGRRALVHSARTAVAAVISLIVARALGLPEAYWATVTTLIIMQSTLGAALTVSEQRLAGTAMGAVMGALLTTYFGSNVIVFGLGVFALGLVCAALHLEDAYRLASVTLAIVMLICAHEAGVDGRGSPLRRSRRGNRRGISCDRSVAWSRADGKYRTASFPFEIKRKSIYFVVAFPLSSALVSGVAPGITLFSGLRCCS